MQEDKYIVRKKKRVLKMLKDIIICIVIIIVIIAFDVFIQNYIKDSSEEITSKLNTIREQVIAIETEKIDEINTKELRESWENRYKKLASVIEHDELEKVENSLTAIYSALESKEQSEAIVEVDKSIFILRHIKDKYRFRIENVF